MLLIGCYLCVSIHNLAENSSGVDKLQTLYILHNRTQEYGIQYYLKALFKVIFLLTCIC